MALLVIGLVGVVGLAKTLSPRVEDAVERLEGPVVLGLDAKEIVLLALTAVVSSRTFGSGQATVLQGVQHLAIFDAFVFLSVFS